MNRLDFKKKNATLSIRQDTCGENAYRQIKIEVKKIVN